MCINIIWIFANLIAKLFKMFYIFSIELLPITFFDFYDYQYFSIFSMVFNLTISYSFRAPLLLTKPSSSFFAYLFFINFQKVHCHFCLKNPLVQVISYFFVLCSFWFFGGVCSSDGLFERFDLLFFEGVCFRCLLKGLITFIFWRSYGPYIGLLRSLILLVFIEEFSSFK